MSMHPQFSALLVAMILCISILGSDHVPAWRIWALFGLGVFALSATSGAYSFLGPNPALNVEGQVIRDIEGHPLFRSKDVLSAEAFMNASVYLGFGCIIAALILGVIKLLSSEIRTRNLSKRDATDFKHLEPK